VYDESKWNDYSNKQSKSYQTTDFKKYII